MWVSVASGLLNLVLDLLLIFGIWPDPRDGHCRGCDRKRCLLLVQSDSATHALLLRPKYEAVYCLRTGFGFDRAVLGNLLFFGFPTGLMYLTESGGFTVIVLRIGSLGDIPLRATTMAINFNMIAFIPLVGVSIAASVLVGRHLLQSGPARAARSVYGALAIGGCYSGIWLFGYLAIPDVMMSLYELNESGLREGGTDARESIALARGLLKFVAIYVVLDAVQLILAGALRGAGDTWFVLLSGVAASAIALVIGFTFEPGVKQSHWADQLHWWWWMVALWVWLLAMLMAARFIQGSWRQMRMV